MSRGRIFDGQRFFFGGRIDEKRFRLSLLGGRAICICKGQEGKAMTLDGRDSDSIGLPIDVRLRHASPPQPSRIAFLQRVTRLLI